MRFFWWAPLLAIWSILTVHTTTVTAASLPSIVMGVDLGTESARVGFFSLQGELIASEAVAYETYFPAPGYAEQDPSKWWECMGEACRTCLTQSKMLSATGKPLYQVVGISVDTTACRLVLSCVALSSICSA